MKNIELLAPVGSRESLYLAIINGADAVYLGGKAFNARQYASNFDNEELESAVKLAHIMGVKVYITLNILLKEKELEEVIDYILFLYRIDVDAIILQDIGLIKLIKEILPDFEIHASTQMTINNTEGTKFLEKLGFSRVVLAREVSVDNIRKIKENTDIELEGFIHGALCVSYSGQCLLSSIIGGRSGNRGRCAQPCRMKYSLVNKNNKIINGTEEKHLLSPKDLNTIENLEEVIDSGISSLKIEGRMKRPEYVATIISKYRKKLDYILGRTTDDITNEDKKEIKQIFNREFTKGFILNASSKAIVNLDKSNNAGIELGKVIEIRKAKASIKLLESLNLGDGIEIRNQKGDVGFKVEVLYDSNGNKVNYVKAGDIAIVKAPTSIDKNSIVFKTSDAKILEKALDPIREGFNVDLPINMAIELKLDSYPKLYLWDDKGNHAEVIGKNKVEKGINIFLSKDKVIEQMSKLGNTPFTLNTIEVNMDDGIMVRLGDLNKLRRDGIDYITNKKSIKNNRKVVKEVDKKRVLITKRKMKSIDNKKLSIKVRSIEQFDRLDLDKVDRIYLEFIDGVEKAIEKLNETSVEKYISLRRIIEDDEFTSIENILKKFEKKIDGVSISNLGGLNFVKDRFSTKIHCDIGINIFNSQALKLLKEQGVDSGTLSPELSLSEVRSIYNNSNMELEVNGYGYLPVMYTKYCPSTQISNCDSNNCDSCSGSDLALIDRKGMKFRFVRDYTTTTIYNSQPVFIADKLDKVKDIDIIRLDFNFDDENIEEIQNIYYSKLNNYLDDDNIDKMKNRLMKENGFTRGHLFRGVL